MTQPKCAGGCGDAPHEPRSDCTGLPVTGLAAPEGKCDERADDITRVVLQTTGAPLSHAAIARDCAEHDCEQELRNIANANRFDRERFEGPDSFCDWAQSRARHTLRNVMEGREGTSPLMPASAARPYKSEPWFHSMMCDGELMEVVDADQFDHLSRTLEELQARFDDAHRFIAHDWECHKHVCQWDANEQRGEARHGDRCTCGLDSWLTATEKK